VGLSGLKAQNGRDAARPAEAVNMVIATQAFGGPYQFTDEHYLLEVAREIRAMGSNFIKFQLSGSGYTRKPYFFERLPEVRSVTDLLTKHPVYRELMEMDFRYYHIWAMPYRRVRWQDGMDREEILDLYREFYELTTHLMTEYAGTGKQFYLGHWEGDWVLLGGFDASKDPTPIRIQGFAQFLNARQKAIEDARSQFEDSDVQVFHYTEVNQVVKGLDGSRPTLTNAVLPLIDIDYVSYSSYDTIQKPNMREALHEALDHIESKMKPRPDLPGKRVFVGEYAIKASSVDYDPITHDERNREVTRAILEWGAPFAVYWQFYCNEPRGDGFEGFWLVDNEGRQTPLYDRFTNYYANLNTFVHDHIEKTGERPSEGAIRAFAIEHF
jgi:hypothetical protein